MENAEKQQLVIVERAQIAAQTDDDYYKGLYPDMIQAILLNKSDKTIKNFKVSALGYDSNGLPVKIKLQFGFSEAFELSGLAENVNILPDETYGEDYGWGLHESHRISTVLACVKEVEFYDGTTWVNPYYEFWLEEHLEKPLNDDLTSKKV